MTTQTVLSGFLQDFSVAEILQVVELGGMTGAIHLKQSTGRVGILYCNEGKLANCAEFDPGALTLGDVLQQLGMAALQDIELAFSQQLRDVIGKRIGERLVAKQIISEQQLREALRTQVLWTARELALWQEGTYEFISSQSIEKLLPYGEPSLDIEVSRVTMEMVCYHDEWQAMQAVLPQGMLTALQLSASIPTTMTFPVRFLELLMHVNMYYQIRRIASRLHRPELEIAREAADLVKQGLLQHSFQQATPSFSGYSRRKVRLPIQAEKLRLEHFELLNLISRMEQEWEKRRTPVEQLPAFVEFVNWTMDALADACRANGTELGPNTLKSLLLDEHLLYMGTYEFHVEQNHIDVKHFTNLCCAVLNDHIQKATRFYDEASKVLEAILRSILSSINARVADPRERMENQEVWEAMFEEFALRRQ